MPLNFISPNALNDVVNYVASDATLNPHVLEVQSIDDVLVILIDGKLSASSVEPLLQTIWPGPIEVYSPSDMIIGA